MWILGLIALIRREQNKIWKFVLKRCRIATFNIACRMLNNIVPRHFPSFPFCSCNCVLFWVYFFSRVNESFHLRHLNHHTLIFLVHPVFEDFLL